MWALTVSSLVMVITALTHSIVGERKLIRPILELRQLQTVLELGAEAEPHVMKSRRARRILRFAWHFTSVLMILCAVVIVWPDIPYALIAIIGFVWLVAGIFDAIFTRGKHVGWPLLVAAGALALTGVYFLAGISL